MTWLKDGVEIKSANYRRSVKDGHCTMTIDETFGDDTATYTCRATSQAGVADTQAKLKVRGMLVLNVYNILCPFVARCFFQTHALHQCYSIVIIVLFA